MRIWTVAVPVWEFVLRVRLYLFLLVLLRLRGKRQVGRLAPFDLVVFLALSNAVQELDERRRQLARGWIDRGGRRS